MIIPGGTHRTPKTSAPKSARGKSDSGASRKGSGGPVSRTRDVVLLGPCRGVIRPKIKGALKRRRYYAPLRITARVIKQLAALAGGQLACLIPVDSFNSALNAPTTPAVRPAPREPAADRAPAFLSMGL